MFALNRRVLSLGWFHLSDGLSMSHRKRSIEWYATYDIADYPEDDDCCQKVHVLSENTVNLAISALRTASFVPKRWKNNEVSITSDEDIERARFLYNQALRELMMSCDNGFEKGLIAIADAIERMAANGCGCSGGNGENGSGGTGYYPSPPPAFSDETGSDFPEEFSSREEYDRYRCSVAHQIFEATKETLQLWLTIEFTKFLEDDEGATLLAGTLITLAVTPLPGARILGIAVALIAAAILAIQDVVINGNLLASWDAREDDIVCALYEAKTASDAIQDIKDIWLEEIEANSGLLDRAPAITIANEYVNMDMVRALFEDNGTKIPVSNDCASLCGDPYFVVGNGDYYGQANSEVSNGLDRMSVVWPDGVTVNDIAFTGWSDSGQADSGSNDLFFYSDEAGTSEISRHASPAAVTYPISGVVRFGVRSGSSFTVVLDVTDSV